MIEPYGIVAMLIASSMMLITLREFLHKKLSLLTFIEWTIVWLILFLTGPYPEFYKGAVATLGMATPIHFVTTFSVIVLFVMTYRLYLRITEMDKKTVKIVQHIALKSKINEN